MPKPFLIRFIKYPGWTPPSLHCHRVTRHLNALHATFDLDVPTSTCSIFSGKPDIRTYKSKDSTILGYALFVYPSTTASQALTASRLATHEHHVKAMNPLPWKAEIPMEAPTALISEVAFD